jgi:hypothetical protein
MKSMLLAIFALVSLLLGSCALPPLPVKQVDVTPIRTVSVTLVTNCEDNSYIDGVLPQVGIQLEVVKLIRHEWKNTSFVKDILTELDTILDVPTTDIILCTECQPAIIRCISWCGDGGWVSGLRWLD